MSSDANTNDLATPSAPVPISKRIVLINSLSGLMTRLLTVGVFAWAIQYLIKRIPDQEMALLPLVMSVAMLLPLLQVILTSGLSRHVTEAYARNDLSAVTQIVSSQFPLLVVSGALLLTIGGLIAWNIHYILSIPPDLVDKTRLMLLLVIGRMSLGAILAPFNTGLFARQQFVLQNAIEIAASFIRIALMLGLILGLGPRVEWVIVALVASQTFVLVASTAASMHSLPALRYRRKSFSWAMSKHVLSFGVWYFVIEFSSFIRRSADPPILFEFASPIAVNDFFLGSTVDTQLREATLRASIPLLPALTAMHAHRQQERLASAFLRGGRIALWVAMSVAVPLMVFSYDLFALYLGDKFEKHADAPTVMIILLSALPILYPTSMFIRIANARGDLRPIAIRTLTTQLGNLFLTLLFVGWLKLGAVGSASATLIAYAVMVPLSFWPLALRTLDLSWSRFLGQSLLPGLTPAVVGIVAGLLTMPLAGDSSLARVVVGVPVCLFAYAVTLLFVLKPADRADLGRVRRTIAASLPYPR